jgi:YceI-like domain
VRCLQGRPERSATLSVRTARDADRLAVARAQACPAALDAATDPHPGRLTITFRSKRVEGSAGSFTVDGELTVMGVTRPVTLQGRVADGRIVGGATVVQSRWGIRPYSAFFGALKLSDEVKIDFDIALTAHG